MNSSSRIIAKMSWENLLTKDVVDEAKANGVQIQMTLFPQRGGQTGLDLTFQKGDVSHCYPIPADWLYSSLISMPQVVLNHMHDFITHILDRELELPRGDKE